MRRLAWLWVLLPVLARAEELPVYPGAVHTRIGEDLVIAGEHHRLAYFVTRDPVSQVAGYFFQAWRSKGLPTVLDGDGVDEAVVSAFRTREGIQRAVVLRRLRRQGGRTLGFVVLKDLWTRAEGPPMPRIEGTLLSQDLVSREDGGGVQRAVLVEAGLDQARARVEASLGEQGFRPVRGRTARAGAGAWDEFVRGEERVLVAFSEPSPGLVVVLQAGGGAPGASAGAGP